MRLKISKCKNVNIFYVIKTVYIDGKEKTVTVERLGSQDEILKKSNGEDPVLWAKKYIEKLNKEEKEKSKKIPILKSPSTLLEKDKQNLFNCGYFFLEKIYHQLQLDNICKDISTKHKFTYDFNNILSRLIYSRIIYPSSKLATYELSKKFVEQPNFDLQHIYRALVIIAKEDSFIQSELYKNSLKVCDRKTGILYYDCTNYFFEIEDEDEFRKYGPSKEHRPNPITQMGLFMDGNGIPLAFCMNAGNVNEQLTLTPLEEKIIKDFDLSKFVVCTDAGLASNDNRIFNTKGERAFITTQSIKKLKSHLKSWALSPDGWHLTGSDKTFNINLIAKKLENISDEKQKQKIMNLTFYKERWIHENNLEQRLIVTFSFKYQTYQKHIRDGQIERAKSAIESKNFKLDRRKQTDFKRFIKQTSITKDGEIANKKVLTINSDTISKESQFDGFYGVCTNLEDPVEEIIKVNHRRWEIEESFRIMKSEFKARPVYLSREDRIRAHFTICFISLLMLRLLEKKIDEKYSSFEIINCLRNMELLNHGVTGYEPVYTRTDLTDLLHEQFGFRTDYEITDPMEMKKILRILKK